MNGLKEARACGGDVCVSWGEEGQTHLSKRWTVHNVVGNGHPLPVRSCASTA